MWIKFTCSYIFLLTLTLFENNANLINFEFLVFLLAILRNEVGWFDEEEHNSSLVAARLATDAADVKSAIAERISVILQNMTSLLTSFIVAFIVEWRVSLLILATFPLLVLANFAQVKKKYSHPKSIFYLSPYILILPPRHHNMA